MTAARFSPGTSRAAGKRATTRPQQPARVRIVYGSGFQLGFHGP